MKYAMKKTCNSKIIIPVSKSQPGSRHPQLQVFCLSVSIQINIIIGLHVLKSLLKGPIPSLKKLR